jgi:hypothetical protein
MSRWSELAGRQQSQMVPPVRGHSALPWSIKSPQTGLEVG